MALALSLSMQPCTQLCTQVETAEQEENEDAEEDREEDKAGDFQQPPGHQKAALDHAIADSGQITSTQRRDQD